MAESEPYTGKNTAYARHKAEGEVSFQSSGNATPLRRSHRDGRNYFEQNSTRYADRQLLPAGLSGAGHLRRGPRPERVDDLSRWSRPDRRERRGLPEHEGVGGSTS